MIKTIACTIALSALILTSGHCSVVAATISGRVTLDSHRGASSAVVYIDGNTPCTPLKKAEVDQRNRMFMPHISVITAGTTVQFPNDDTVFHNVFAYFNAKKFDLGMYPRGVSKSVKFDQAGLVAVLCNVHPDMSAYIMVVRTPYYVIAGSDGSYSIKNLPAGDYTIHAWHESGQKTSRKLTVTKADQALDLNLSPS